MDIASPTPTRTPDGCFAPGCSGNPKGRPIGSRNRASVMAEALEAGEPETLIREYADAAHGGDKVALRFCVGRLVPPVRGRTIVLDVPPGTELDFRAGYTRVLRAVYDGEITPEEGLKLAQLLTVGKGKLYLRSLPEPEAEAEEAEDDEEPAPWTSREVLFLREMARMRMAMDAAAAPPAPGAAGAAPAASPDAGDAGQAASPPPPATARADETRATDAGAPAPSADLAAPAPRRIFGTVVRKPEVLAAKLAIV